MLKKTKILKLSVAPPARDVEDAADAAQREPSDRATLLCWGPIQKKWEGFPLAKDVMENLRKKMTE